MPRSRPLARPGLCQGAARALVSHGRAVAGPRPRRIRPGGVVVSVICTGHLLRLTRILHQHAFIRLKVVDCHEDIPRVQGCSLHHCPLCGLTRAVLALVKYPG